jgi:glycosyltransferase involved in cell wall biosynthesis
MEPVVERSDTALDLSVILPVYRNASTLREIHGRIAGVCLPKGVRYEILYVNDACPEGSGSVLSELERAYPEIRVVSLAQNGGQQRAILAGLKQCRGNRAVVMDADLQDPPEAIPALLNHLGDGISAVFAGRQGRYESPARLMTSRIFKTLLHLLCGAPKDAGAFVLMDRRMIDGVLAMDASSPFLVAMIACSGLPMRSIPVERAERPDGQSAYVGGMRLQVALSALWWVLRWRTGFVRTEPDRPT